MIFVTVGTHEQQFNRLIFHIDSLKEKQIIKEKVIIQTGFSTYIPKHCEWHKFIPYNEMKNHVENSRITITHGGPSSIIMPLQIGKIPVVVPRRKIHDEHVNDHQLEFAEKIKSRQGNIILVKDVSDLENVIVSYNTLLENIPTDFLSNNDNFINKFERIINSLVNGESKTL